MDVAVGIRLEGSHEVHCDSVERVVREEGTVQDIAGAGDTPSQLTVRAGLNKCNKVALHRRPEVASILQKSQRPINTKVVGLVMEVVEDLAMFFGDVMEVRSLYYSRRMLVINNWEHSIVRYSRDRRRRRRSS